MGLRCTAVGWAWLAAIGCGREGPAPQGDDTSSSAAASTTASTTATASSEGTASTGADTSTSTAAGSTSETGEPALVDVSITFAAFVGDEPFACGQSYPDVGMPPTTIEPRDLRFFVHDVALVRASDATLVPVVLDVVEPWQSEAVALVDFEDGTGACAGSGGDDELRMIVTGAIPDDDYDGVAFTLGVPAALNHEDPLFATPPLHATSMTWSWLYGYKFVKAELDEVVGEGGNGSVQLHLGSNACAGMPGVDEVTCALANRARVELDGFEASTDTIAFDVAALFADTDITIDTQCHTFQPECDPMMARLGLDPATGQATPETQVVFDAR